MKIVTSKSVLRKAGYAPGRILSDEEYEAAMEAYAADREAERSEAFERFRRDGMPGQRIVVDSSFMGGTAVGRVFWFTKIKGSAFGDVYRVQTGKSRQTVVATVGKDEMLRCTRTASEA